MLNDSILPGDFICFELSTDSETIWKIYLAPGVLKDKNGEHVWHEIKSGDVGIVVDSSCQHYGIIIVLISRLNCLLKIQRKRIRKLHQSLDSSVLNTGPST
jgi:hypothetical protein